MRAEIVPIEMDVEIDQAWADSHDNRSATNARVLPALLPQSGEEARVRVEQFGGLAIVYGLDRRIPDLNNSAHDMVTWVIGNVKLVFTTEEWAMLVVKTDQVIAAGRKNWEVVL